MSTKDFKFAVIFSEENVRNDFVSCISTAMTVMIECDEAVVLAEGPNGLIRVTHIIANAYRGDGGLAGLEIHIDRKAENLFSIDAEYIEDLFSIANTLNGASPKRQIEDCIEIAEILLANYNISHK